MIEITEVYVGAIYVEGSEGETIYRGNYRVGKDVKGNPIYESRATVEHVLGAVPSLVDMCKAVVEGLEAATGKKVTFRILHFSKDGVEEVDVNKFDEMVWYGHLPMKSY